MFLCERVTTSILTLTNFRVYNTKKNTPITPTQLFCSSNARLAITFAQKIGQYQPIFYNFVQETFLLATMKVTCNIRKPSSCPYCFGPLPGRRQLN